MNLQTSMKDLSFFFFEDVLLVLTVVLSVVCCVIFDSESESIVSSGTTELLIIDEGTVDRVELEEIRDLFSSEGGKTVFAEFFNFLLQF